MNISQQIRTFIFFLLTLFATGCSKEDEHNSFLKANGIKETNKVPSDYNNGNGWTPLAGNYVYFIDLFTINNSPELVYILADKKENKLLFAYHLNPHIMPATYAPHVKPPTIVTNYYEISDVDREKADDMTGLNALFRSIPELKNFSWKNELQNTIVSGIIFKAHFIYAIKDSIDDKLFQYEEKPVIPEQSQLLKQIFSGRYSFFNRSVKRLNADVEMSKFIKDLGFFFEKNSTSTSDQKNQKYFINDLLNNPIDFKTPGKLCLFYPSKSYIRTQNKGETPFYDPAVAAHEYSFIPDQNGFPKFKRTTQYVSLLKDNPDTKK